MAENSKQINCVNLKMQTLNEHGQSLFMISYGKFDSVGLSNSVYVYARSDKEALAVIDSISKEMNYMVDLSKCSIA